MLNLPLNQMFNTLPNTSPNMLTRKSANKSSNKPSNKGIVVKLAGLLLLLSQASFAQDFEITQGASHSIGIVKDNTDESAQSKTTLIEKANITPRTLALKGMKRIDVKNLQQQKLQPSKGSITMSQNAEYKTDSYYSFSIYGGYSQLISDIDEDGYYQTFSVTFDADILSSVSDEEALVYADLYLSRNGGPWTLYFSTDNFIITGESTLDEFEVVTQLDSGYVPDNYNVLIDLYEVGYSDVVATYSSNDSNSLYALPLESRDYDPEYIEVIHEVEYGGESSWLLFGALFVLVIRAYRIKLPVKFIVNKF
jgi:hypothetical protein